MHIRDAVQHLTPYRPGQTLADVRGFGLTSCIKLGSNENPLGPAPAVIAAMQEAIGETRLYPEPGAPRLRSALAAHYGRAVEETIVGAGIDDLLDLTVRCLLDPGDNLVLAFPGFIRYEVAAGSAGGHAVRVPGTASAPYDHDLEGMLAAIDPRTRIVALVNPNNPTGSRFDRAALEDFLRRVPESVLTILDEAYFEFVDDSAYPNGMEFLDQEKPLLVFRTFSKIHALAGLRVGFGFGPPRLIDHLDRARLPFNVNSVAHAAALAAISQDEHVVRSRELARAETAFLARELSARGWTVQPTWTNFLFTQSPLPGKELADGLLRRGFILRPLTGFGLDASFFRVSHGTRPENQAFLKALDAVASALAAQ